MEAMNLIFVIKFEIKNIEDKINVIWNNSWDISGESFVKHIFVAIILGKNKVPFSFQGSLSCKNSSLCKI